MATTTGRATGVEPAPGPQRIAVQNGAEAFVEMLSNNGVEYIFLNSGTDTFPVQEAILRLGEKQRKAPQIILCIDEGIALPAAQGYFQLTHQPQVVLVHVDAGTLQLGGAYHNVQRDRAGVVVCAGRAPTTIADRLPGAKDLNIHWLQEQRDQHGINRTFTKWDYELRRNESLHWVTQKAFQVASSEPAGPVYLTLPRENLLEKMEYLDLPPISRHSAPVAPAADPAALATLADWLVSARSPLIVAGTPGRYPESVAHLAALAEAVAAPVCGALSTRMNLPTNHPMNAGFITDQRIKEADVILVIDDDVPWLPSPDTLEPEAKIAWIDIDASKDTIPMWSFPADLLIHAASRKALPALLDAINERLTAADRQRIAERVARISAETQARREKVIANAQATGKDRPLKQAWIAHCLNQVLPEDGIVLSETVRSASSVTPVLQRTQPGTYFGSGGASLGYALGAALGAKLARPEKDVVAMVGDGSFVFGRPTAAFWAAEKYNLPFLTIILNNQRHFATRESWEKHIPDSAAQRAGNFVGVDIEPSPDYEVLIQACRGYGERVEDPDEVLPAIQRGLERTRNGQAALLDMRIVR
ncbi:MAG TPA: thiamine pyrophosphate-requiring protein [Dehalococcoidia bacterium]|nr:thiamine pyrophosphate-requiring protein [Dehalococcoidia bacterium]